MSISLLWRSIEVWLNLQQYKIIFDFVLGVKKTGSPKQEPVGVLGGLSLRRAVDAGEKELRESPTEPDPCLREGPSSFDGQYTTLDISQHA